MNTITTLFGGLAAVFVLYAIGGLFRSLPPVLRALLAGIVPLVSYFALIVGNWPGLDVVSIHISVFLAAALVLHAFSEYRKRSSGRMHWAPKLLTLFFIGLIFLNGTLLYISTQGLPESIGRWWLGSAGGPVYSGFSGVVSHGQGAAKAVSSELSETHRESLVGWEVDVDGLRDEGRRRAVEIRVRDRTGLPVEHLEVEMRTMRPGAAQPVAALPMQAAQPGVYRATLALPAAGRWLVEFGLQRDGVEHYHTVREVVVP